MKDVALCFLAYGDEHIIEFNTICKKLSLYYNSFPIFVLTDNKSKIQNQSINIIETNEPFNFNLKRYVIEESFKQYETVVMLDTDIDINVFDFIYSIDLDGMYVEWVDPKLTHRGLRLDAHNNQYCIELSKLNKHQIPIQFIPEYCVIIKIKDVEKRKEFTKRWGEIHNLIKEFEPTDRHYNLDGAIEGCIMYLTSMDLNIPIIQYGKQLQITHYASHSNFDKKLV